MLKCVLSSKSGPPRQPNVGRALGPINCSIHIFFLKKPKISAHAPGHKIKMAPVTDLAGFPLLVALGTLPAVGNLVVDDALRLAHLPPRKAHGRTSGRLLVGVAGPQEARVEPTLRQRGCMISLQIVHSIRLRLNLSSSPSTVSSFPASPHARHTAVCGSTGCMQSSQVSDPARWERVNIAAP